MKFSKKMVHDVGQMEFGQMALAPVRKLVERLDLCHKAGQKSYEEWLRYFTPLSRGGVR